MPDKIKCPHCLKMNEIHKFCVFCGKQLFSDDEEMKLFSDDPEPYCINCGRPVKKGQTKCKCGYEFGIMKCPACEEINEYANRFCTSCGKKLWKSNVFDYQYSKRLFETHFFNDLPPELRNISVYGHHKSFLKIKAGDISELESLNLKQLKSKNLKADEALNEILSRWKIVSPHYCINCLNIIKPNEYTCPNCGLNFSEDKKRVEYLQNTENNYIEPLFVYPDIKLNLKYDEYYFNSLAPTIGESQFEYRERLKWEYAENKIYKNNIEKVIEVAIAPKPVYKTQTHSYGSSSQYEDFWDFEGVYYEEWAEMHGINQNRDND